MDASREPTALSALTFRKRASTCMFDPTALCSICATDSARLAELIGRLAPLRPRLMAAFPEAEVTAIRDKDWC